jgi:hypothetical protein
MLLALGSSITINGCSTVFVVVHVVERSNLYVLIK